MSNQATARFHGMNNLCRMLVMFLVVFAFVSVMNIHDCTGMTAWSESSATGIADTDGNLPMVSDHQENTAGHLSSVRIGVLAHKGIAICRQMWQPTMDYLEQSLPGHSFVLVPLTFDDIKQAVRNRSIDFLICNPAIYVDFEVRYGITRTLTLRNLAGTQIVSEYGGVVFCRSDRRELQRLQNVRDHILAATDQFSFGGWHMALREFRSEGIEPGRDCSRLVFLDTHPAVVRAVISGEADIGIVRTDTIERMAANGEIRMDEIRVIPARAASEGSSAFPYLHSTRLYPEWPFAKLSGTSDDLARELTLALLGMPADSSAAKAAQSGGWGVCLSYGRVHECLRELRLPPYEYYGQVNWPDFLRQYRMWIAAVAMLFIALLGVLALLRGRQLAVIKVSSQNRLLLASAGEGICATDIYGTTTFVNPAAICILGYSADELIGRNLHALTHHKKPDGSPYPVHECPIFMACKDGTIHQGSDEFFYRRDGSAIPISYFSRPIVDGGRITGAVVCFQDITDSKLAEETLRASEDRFRNLFENNTAVQLIIESDTGAIIEANQSAADFYGWPVEELRQMHIQDINQMPPEAVQSEMEKVLSWVSRVFEFRHRTADGSIRDVEVFCSRVEIRGKILLYSIIHDVTERRKAETERLKLEAQLQQAQKLELVGRLAGGVAHDFSNMLGIILGYTEMELEQSDPSQPLHKRLNEIRKAGERSADLIRQLLTFARKQAAVPRVLNLNRSVESMLKMLKRLIGEDIDLVWLPGTNLWPVSVDPSQIDQILANLCVNARDAISGTGKIVIETDNCIIDEDISHTQADVMPGEFVKLNVNDNGEGMDQKTLDHVFEPFFTTKEMGKGTGLGLATVYGIVRQNNGIITVSSERGKGTTFTICLPRHTGDAAGHMQKDTSAEPAMQGHETILLVEDEPAILEMTRMMLEKLGYTVLATAVPGEAVRLADAHTGPVHLIMTDVIMPGMNGRDLANLLLNHYPEARLLFMSGYTPDIIARHGVLNPGINFIQKPFQLKTLAARIRDVLDAES